MPMHGQKRIWACAGCHNNCIMMSVDDPGDIKCPMASERTQWYHWDKRMDDRDEMDGTFDRQTIIDDFVIPEEGLAKA